MFGYCSFSGLAALPACLFLAACAEGFTPPFQAGNLDGAVATGSADGGMAGRDGGMGADGGCTADSGRSCAPPPTGTPLMVDCDASIDTSALQAVDTATICGNDVAVRVESQADGPDVFVFSISNLTVGAGGTLSFTGQYPVVLVVGGDADIAGTVEISADGATPGPGGNVDCGASAGAEGGTSGSNGSGGGGGALGSRGGAGGDTNSGPTPGGAAGETRGDPSGVPLLGGCAGGQGGSGGGAAGAGGGALRLMVAGSLIITGSLRANGGDGQRAGNNPGGGGGGSGGSIIIDAGTLDGTGSVVAEGGRGGGGDAAGGGGSGATSADQPGGDGASSGSTDGGSGGGGGYGRIVITADTCNSTLCSQG